MFKYKTLFSAVLISLFAGQSFAQSAFELDGNVDINAVLSYSTIPDKGMTLEMQNQLEHGGCIPRGMALADSGINARFKTGLNIVPAGSEVIVRFRFCEDPLALILPNSMRMTFGVNGVAYPANNGDKISKTRNLTLSLRDPDGQSVEMSKTHVSVQGTTSLYYRTVGYEIRPIQAQMFIDTNKAGVYELVVKNSSRIDLKLSTIVTLFGNAVPQ